MVAGPGKGANSSVLFRIRPRRSRAGVEALAADMLLAYALEVCRNLPDAVLVNDRFQVVKLHNELLTERRRQLDQQATEQLAEDVLEGIRGLPLRRNDKLSDERGQRARLETAQDLNQSPDLPCDLRGELNLFREQPETDATSRFLSGGIQNASSSGIRLVRQSAKTRAAGCQSLLAQHDGLISTASSRRGLSKAVSNKIRPLNLKASGYIDPEIFRLELDAVHKARSV